MNDLPALTTTFREASGFIPDEGSVYVSGASLEDRSEHTSSWKNNCRNVEFCSVEKEDFDAVEFRSDRLTRKTVSLRSAVQLRDYWRQIGTEDIYLDITGLRHGTWAGLLRGLHELAPRRLRIVYVEPESYRMNPHPTQNQIFDLSEDRLSVRPLPGFARLRRSSVQSVFAPLLGFEGTRLLFLINALEPAGQFIFPIVGVPGYRPEYPFVTYWANRTALRQTQSWKKAIFAPAICPFATLNAIHRLKDKHPTSALTLAPIGTKPQALAAVVAALQHPDSIELVYDHPIRKPKRTSGTSKLHVFELTGVIG